MQCILVKSDEFENSFPLLYIFFFINPVYVAARSLRSLRSNINVKNYLSPACYIVFWLNTLKRTAKAPAVDLLRLNTLKPRPNDHNTPTQHITTLLGATFSVRLATVLRHVGCCQICANNTQHVATGWLNARSMLRSTML